MSVVPTMGATVNVEVSAEYPSVWAMDTVMEGQNYGIYPLTWHDDFRAKITKAQIAELQRGIGNKISSITGVMLLGNSVKAVIKDNTRGEVLKQLFWEIKQFAYPKDLGLEGIDAITFMKKNKIISGDAKDLGLNRACTIEEAIVFGTRIIDWLYDELDAGTKGYFWKVDGGKNDVYLLGSIHAADSRLYPFDKEVLEAYDKADVVGFEINELDEEDYNKFANLAVYSDGTLLKDHISKELYDVLVSCQEEIGLTEDQMNKLKVWYLSNYISTLSLEDSREVEEAQEAVDYGVDSYFFYKAYYDDKEIYGLESYELQAQVFDSFSDELQEYLLVENLYSLLYSPDISESFNQEELAELEEMSNQWLTLMKTGDVEGFKVYYGMGDDIGDDDLSQEYLEKLITNRDKKMAEKIEGCLESDSGDTYFIIVGAAHYISATNNGVIDQLREKGYTVIQIK